MKFKDQFTQCALLISFPKLICVSGSNRKKSVLAKKDAVDANTAVTHIAYGLITKIRSFVMRSGIDCCRSDSIAGIGLSFGMPTKG